MTIAICKETFGFPECFASEFPGSKEHHLCTFFRSKEKIVSGSAKGFRFKFRETYIHIRSKLNPSCDSVRLIEVMKACIYTWLNLNLKPFFLDRNPVL